MQTKERERLKSSFLYTTFGYLLFIAIYITLSKYAHGGSPQEATTVNLSSFAQQNAEQQKIEEPEPEEEVTETSEQQDSKPDTNTTKQFQAVAAALSSKDANCSYIDKNGSVVNAPCPKKVGEGNSNSILPQVLPPVPVLETPPPIPEYLLQKK